MMEGKSLIILVTHGYFYDQDGNRVDLGTYRYVQISATGTTSVTEISLDRVNKLLMAHVYFVAIKVSQVKDLIQQNNFMIKTWKSS